MPLRWPRRVAVTLLCAVGAAFLVVGWTPVMNLAVLPLAGPWPPPHRADVAIVLSGGRYRDGSLNDASEQRTVRAVVLYHRGLAPTLFFTGGPCCGESASAIMARLAEDLGVPRAAIVLDEEATRTHDSAVNAAAFLRARGMKSAILVTSELHMPRARLAFAAAGVPVFPARAEERDIWLRKNPADRLSLLSAAIHEYGGLVYYRLRGWL
ncbi:MAG TPA: YdcF family protein [Methylomirabilota bacterium]|jgi:uncharacterized SAM-binding protein YcdF (DUF218 family)